MIGLIHLAHAQADAMDTFIKFKNQDNVVQLLKPEELDTFSRQTILNIFEVHERRERQYKAYPVQPVLDRIFGQGWRAADEIVFSCKDGYQPSIPVAKFLAYDAYLAVASADGSPFILDNTLQNHEVVELGPVYLVWNNLKFPILLAEGAADMPYQIIGIELATFATRFPGMFPPARVSAEVKRGFLHFRKYCMACHTINGQGGGKAPELNYPISVTEYFKPEYLKRWIDDPASLRYNTTMPALAAEIPEREKVLEEIIAYLTAMQRVKHTPPAKNSKK
ncbi:Cytochrome C oxidase, cbb3-type, subunit III [Nitrosomonas eutropha]|uniref:c-type cytochrome n=1 Tax=Nitrosomonas eutropha TaxID=916 RepID=UPI0008900E52|nr:cytochrome c [Nitrosomonas eutropha]SCX20010.1 Cytochrome C oxidase, cbb3-type, subunit III [Nitrosomonas eutropha]